MSSPPTIPQTTYSTTNWASYQKGRPAYPPSLTSLITTYHTRHAPTSWNRLVDIGAGSGIASLNFISNFKTVHISDPSPSNESQARPFLSKYVSDHNLDTKLEYSQSVGEEAYQKTGSSSADLAICATAAHFMDPDGLSSSIGKMLKPGGTLAVYSYWMPVFPGQGKRLHDAFAKTLDGLVLKPVLAAGERGKEMLGKVLDRRMTGKGALDSLPLSNDTFEDVTRVYINSPREDLPYRDLSRQFSPDNEPLGGPSRVDPQDRILHFRSGVDAEAEGWAYEDVDKAQISAFLDSVRPLGGQVGEEEYRRVYGEWEAVFDEECPGGKVRVEWPVYVVLARRRGGEES